VLGFTEERRRRKRKGKKDFSFTVKEKRWDCRALDSVSGAFCLARRREALKLSLRVTRAEKRVIV
jgi:hypothetical protein